jgi:hypothetical protein
MLFGKDIRNENIEIYISFLSDIIEKDNATFKQIFNQIVEQAHDLSTGKIDYTKVEASVFDIVSVLSFNHPDYFKSIDFNKIDYSTIRELLTKDLAWNS